jgi:hypothetical protein
MCPNALLTAVLLHCCFIAAAASQPYDAAYLHQAHPGVSAAAAAVPAGFGPSPAMLTSPGFGPNPSMHAVTAGLSSSVSAGSGGTAAEERSRAAAAAGAAAGSSSGSGAAQPKLGGLTGLWGSR